MKQFFTVSSFAKLLGISHDCKDLIESFEIDSRKVRKGSLFFALKGEKVDGHDFLEDVVKKEAVAAIISKNFHKEIPRVCLLKVEDVLSCLQESAQKIFRAKTSKVIAITGSMGKTTTKEFAAALLESSFKIDKTPGNANSQVSIPLHILNAANIEDLSIMEMGMSRSGEISRLIHIAPPDIAVITNIGHGHVEYFPDGKEGIARAKGEILAHSKTSLAIMHFSVDTYAVIRDAYKKRKVLYGLEKDIKGEKVDYILRDENGKCSIFERGVQSPFFSLPFQAFHLKENFLAAAALARELGVSWEKIFARASSLQCYKQRFEAIEKNGILFINDSYNALFEAVKAALISLPKPKPGSKTIAVLGPMRELGRYAKKFHQEIGELASGHVDLLLCFGEECLPMKESFEKSKKNVEHFLDFSRLYKRMYEVAEPGDVVLIKASNSLEFWRLLESKEAFLNPV